MQKLTRLYKSLFLGAVTDRYSVSFNIKSAGFGASATVNKKLIPALSAAVTFRVRRLYKLLRRLR
ncbi:MAG: hypothetical protein ACLR56_11365 [Oscillospiraceae bacterium]